MLLFVPPAQVLPSSSDVVPSMVLQFRLLSFPGERSRVSRTAAWGAFPVCNCAFDVVQGKFRTPLLRGDGDPTLDQFRKVEERLSSDLDNWLCNLYFQVCDPRPLGYVAVTRREAGSGFKAGGCQ